ncbi:hypothetical protein [Streptomyces sp. NPDC127039]|uniref:hypothetical protein n=1 Tax=Streptomyces sp. NPDC127039 TaxID=3347115 RepID=UPI003660044A
MGKSDLALPLTELEDYGRRLRSLKTRLNHTKKLFESYEDDIGDGGVNDAVKTEDKRGGKGGDK